MATDANGNLLVVPAPSVHAGHTILLKFSSASGSGTDQRQPETVGKAQSFDDSHDITQDQVYEIGTPMPTENVATRYAGSFTLDKFFIRKDSLVSAGWVGLAEDVLRSGNLTVQIVDKLDGSAVRTYEGCAVTSYRSTFRANAIAGENASFVFLNAYDNGWTSGNPSLPTTTS